MINVTIKNGERIRRKQDQLCRGAMKACVKKGFHATSMREIADAAEISLGSIYNYIEKKEDILFLLHKDFLGRIYRRLDESAENFDDPTRQLFNAIREVFRLTSELRDQALFIYTETKSLSKEYLQEILKNESEFVSKIETLITNGMDAGVFKCKNPSILANFIAFSFAIIPLRGWNLLVKNTEDDVVNEWIDLFSLRLNVESVSDDLNRGPNRMGK